MIECRGPTCKATIRFVTNADGKKVPVDADPITIVEDSKGPIIAYRLDGVKIRGRLPSEEDPHWNWPRVEVYQTHFQTCPDVGHFRRK